MLDAISRTLRFDAHERSHLFADETSTLSPTVQVLLDRLEPYPALVVNGRYDLWDDTVARMVALYRSLMAEHVSEPAWKSLVARLHRASPEFAEVWARHEIQSPESRIKRVKHPTAGLLAFEFTYLWLDQRLGTRMITYTPADERTQRRLEELSVRLHA